MQTIFEKCPFKENGKLSKLFRLVLQGFNLPAGPDTPQNKILLGIRPRRTRPCGISDPTELSLAGIKPRRTMAELCTFYSIYCTCSAGSDTPLNKALRGIRPRGTKSCGVSNPPRNNIQKRIFLRIQKRIQKYFRVWIRGQYVVDSWKKPKVKNLVLLSL